MSKKGYPCTVTAGGVTYKARSSGSRIFLYIERPSLLGTDAIAGVEQGYYISKESGYIRFYGGRVRGALAPSLNKMKGYDVTGTGAVGEWIDAAHGAQSAIENTRKKTLERERIDREVVRAAHNGNPASILRAAANLHQGPDQSLLLSWADAIDDD